MTIIDTHVHTIFSHDSTITPKQLIEKAKKLKIDAVCVTDHNAFEFNTVLESYKSEKGPLIIRGVELATKNGELLIFGLKDDFWNELHRGIEILPSVDTVMNAVESFNGVAIWAHPFRYYMVHHYDIDYAKYSKINILEAFNGRNSGKENKDAVDYASLNNFKTTGGSDAHSIDGLGRCLTLFKEDIKSEEEFIYALKNSKYLPITYADYKGKDLSEVFDFKSSN